MVKHKKPTNYLSVFDHFLGLAFKGLITRLVGCLFLTVSYYGQSKEHKFCQKGSNSFTDTSPSYLIIFTAQK